MSLFGLKVHYVYQNNSSKQTNKQKTCFRDVLPNRDSFSEFHLFLHYLQSLENESSNQTLFI